MLSTASSAIVSLVGSAQKALRWRHRRMAERWYRHRNDVTTAQRLRGPIMVDHRADRWTLGPPNFNKDRWRVIMRAHAIDNQLCMIVARNNTVGSCIISPKGDLLAWNDGDQEFVTAMVPLDEDHRIWQGGSFRDMNWFQRRPELYKPETDRKVMGNSK